jgi:hypothetical protein
MSFLPGKTRQLLYQYLQTVFYRPRSTYSSASSPDLAPGGIHTSRPFGYPITNTVGVRSTRSLQERLENIATALTN